jgi:hypothetical protein
MFVMLGLIAGGLYLGYLLLTGVLWPALQMMPQLLAGVLRTALTGAAWDHVLWNVLFGMAVGLVIGVLRYVLKVKNKVVRGLVAQLGSETVSAFQIGFVCLVWHLVVGALVGLVVGLLGQLSPFELWMGQDTSTLVGPASDLLRNSGYLPPGGGATGPPPEGSFTILFAIVIITVVLALLLSALASMGAGTVAGSMISGAAEGLGNAIGVAIVVVLTRLWTTKVFMDTTEHRTHADLDVRKEAAAFIRTWTHVGQDPEHRRERLDAFFDWLEKEHVPFTATDVIDAYMRYKHHCKDVGDWEPEIAGQFVLFMSGSDHVEHEDVVSSFYTTDMSPPLTREPTREQLLYPGWFARSIRTGLMTGALTGVLMAIIAFVTTANVR